MSQYTPEPWAYGKDDWDYYYLVEAVQKPEGILCEGLDEEDAKRIVQCVNACARIEDPAAYIADLKTENEILQKAFDEIANEFLGQKGFEKLSNYIGQVMKLKGATR